MSLSNKSCFVLIALIGAMIIFSNLGGIPLLDPDEPVYAETPLEMLAAHDWVSPRIYGDFWYDKPPMYYWLTALSFKVFGVGEFAARLPSAVFGLLTVIMLFFSGKKLFNQRVGLVSALALATSVEFFYLSKAAVTDITLNFFLTASLLSFLHKKYYLFYLFAGFAVVTKGPIGLFFPAVIAFLYLLLTSRLHVLKQMKVFRGGLLFLLLAVPWYAAMYQLHGAAFIDTFLGFHNITRFTSPEHPSGTLWYYYIPVLFIGFFPWVAVLFSAVRQAFVQPRDKFDCLLFLQIWAAVVFLFFTVSQTKLVSYILPMYPALALLVGWYIDQQWRQWYERKRPYTWTSAMIILLTFFGVGCYWGSLSIPAIQTGAYVLIGIFTVWLLLFSVLAWKREIARIFVLNVAAMLCVALTISYLLFPAAAPDFACDRTVKEFRAVYDGKSEIYISKFLRPGFAFYSGLYGRELVFTKEIQPDLEKIMTVPGEQYFVLRTMDYNRLKETERNKLQVLKTVDNKMILSKRKMSQPSISSYSAQRQ